MVLAHMLPVIDYSVCLYFETVNSIFVITCQFSECFLPLVRLLSQLTSNVTYLFFDAWVSVELILMCLFVPALIEASKMHCFRVRDRRLSILSNKNGLYACDRTCRKIQKTCLNFMSISISLLT